MPITLITGPANAGKAQLAIEAVRRHLAHGEEPMLVLPTRADVEHYTRELAGLAPLDSSEGRGVALGVRVERFSGLLEEVVRRAGVGQTPLGAVARERVIETLVTRARAAALSEVGADARTLVSPGLVRSLAELFAELRVRRVKPARLAQAIASALPGAGGLELAELFAAYCATLERLGRTDAEQRAVQALDMLRERPSLWGQTPVALYGFDDLTPLQLDAIETLGRVVNVEVNVALAYEPGRVAFAGRAASYHALAPLAGELRELPARAEHYAAGARTILGHLERALFEAPAQPVDAQDVVRLLEGGGERAELELVAGEINGLLDEGIPGEEIAVLVRSPGTDLDLLAEVFTSAGIPFTLSRRRRLADSAIGRALIGLLRCVPGLDGSSPGELADLLAWLRVPGLLDASDGGSSAVDWLELAARRAGADSADAARALWEGRRQPLETLERFAAAERQGARALCERAARELQWLFSAPWRGRAHVLAEDERDEAAAMASARRALGELRELARSDPELAPRSAAELARVLERLELPPTPLTGRAPAERGEGRHAGGASTAVAVLDPLALRARRVRALFVCGLQEGVFPARGRPRPVLGDEERRRLAELAGLRLGETQDALAAERYLLYAAVSRPRERLFLSWHAADDDGQVTARSLFVDDICDLFAPGLQERRLQRPLGAVELAAGDGARETLTQLRDERVLAWLRERVWSPSSLQKWIGCPVSWFVERVLGPAALEPDPEPLARGSLAHAALRDTLEGLRRETGTARVSQATLERARELLRLALAEHEAEYPLSVAPERATAVRRRLHADLERYLEHAAACESPLEASALELGFGFPDEDADDESLEGGHREGGALPAFDLGGGALLRGRIDRVDVSASGEAVVYDYKASRAPAGARWLRDNDLQVALYMCAVQELLGLPVAGGFYQPLSGEDLRARGVLDRDAGLELECVTQDLREHEEMRELLAQALGQAREAAGEAAAGELSARPQTCAFRGGCMYPSICRSGR